MAKSLDPSSLTRDNAPLDISKGLASVAIPEALRTTYMSSIRPNSRLESLRLLRLFLSTLSGGGSSSPPPQNTADARRPRVRGRQHSPLPRVSVGRGVLEISPPPDVRRRP